MTVSFFAALGTVVLLWPSGVLVAFVAAPFVGSLAVLLVAVGVYATALRREVNEPNASPRKSEFDVRAGLLDK